jgi:hypothetical protein
MVTRREIAMRLDEIVFPDKGEDRAYYWTTVYIPLSADKRIRISRAVMAGATAGDPEEEHFVGEYAIAVEPIPRSDDEPARWIHLDPIAAQAILYHLLGVTTEVTP